MALYTDSEVDSLFKFLISRLDEARKLVGRTGKERLRQLKFSYLDEIKLRREKVEILISYHRVLAKLARKIIFNDIATVDIQCNE